MPFASILVNSFSSSRGMHLVKMQGITVGGADGYYLWWQTCTYYEYNTRETQLAIIHDQNRQVV